MEDVEDPTLLDTPDLPSAVRGRPCWLVFAPVLALLGSAWTGVLATERVDVAYLTRETPL